MYFNSYIFILVFLPLTLLLYHLSPQKNLKTVILILSSYLFYGWGNIYLCLLLFSSSIVDFSIGNKLNNLNINIESNNKNINITNLIFKKRIFLILSILFNISLLSFFKYWDWLIELVLITDNSFFSYSIVRPWCNCYQEAQVIYDFSNLKHYINIPPGISFYTFQTLSYTIDIYRRQFKPTGKFIHYLTFVAFFPQLIAGPIERAKNLLPQLVAKKKHLTKKIIHASIFLIFWGLFKKLVFADNLGYIVDLSNENIDHSGVGFILAFAFAFQIYCDFSAYTDIARGTARLFGVKIRRNFLTPYLAQNPSDFWRRWHISLSEWARDYVYISLGGNKKGISRTFLNLLFTMFIVGLWHGAGIFFIFWGVFHGLLLIFYRIFPIDKYFIIIFGKNIGKMFSILTMFILTLYGWIFFWSKSSELSSKILKSFNEIIFIFYKPSEFTEIFYELFYGVLIFTIPVIITEIIGFKFKREFVEVQKVLSLKYKILLYLAMFYLTLMFGFRGSLEFIYFQF